MATIAFTNNLATNPGLEDVLDANGTITSSTATQFALTNATGGPWNGFVFRFTGTGFAYSSGSPTSGTITQVTVFDASTNVVATVAGPFGDAAIADTWSALQGAGTLAALDKLFSGINTITGSNGVDALTTFGGIETLSAGDGDDVLWARKNGIYTLVGGTGDDVFRIDDGLNRIAGSAQDGSGGAGETNVIELGASGVNTIISFISITNIEGLRFAAPVDGLATWAALDANQIGDGLLSLTLAVEGSTSNSTDRILISDTSTSPAADFDLSGWTFSNWTRANQTIEITLTHVIDYHVVGTSVATQITTGAGNDTVIGGDGGDQISTGDGNDFISGGAGADKLFAGDGNDTIRLAAGDWAAGEWIDGGNGTDTLQLENTGSIDLRTGDVTGIDILKYFSGTSTITAFDNFLGAQVTSVIGSAAVDTLILTSTVGDQDYSGVTFTNWTAGEDLVIILPRAGEPWFYKGTVVNDIFNLTGLAGTTSFNAEGGDDAIILGAGSIPGGNWDGGTGTNTLKLQSANVDLGPVIIANVQQLVYDTGNSTATVSTGEMNAGLFQSITGSAGIDTLIVTGSGGVDLSTRTFSSWTNGTDLIAINATLAGTYTGSSQNDTIHGSPGKDTLDGRGGADTMAGGAGDDSYVVDNLGDVVVENPGEGNNDVVYAAVSGYTLPANVETLWLVGAATSGFGNDAPGNVLVGNALLDSTITGGASGDLMVGAHTSAKTTMIGGTGDDTYVTFNPADVIQELGNGGNDTVYAAVDYTQPANVETLWLVGSATQGTGNNSGGILVANDNVSSTITGGSGADLLVGAHDVTSTLQGGSGNDTYVVFVSGDTVQENPNAGNDIVYSTADFTLPGNVETLWLIGGATHATSNAAGGTLVANNNLNSTLTGGQGGDLLVGGHSSVTTMAGGQGNDTYVSFVAGDVVQEGANGGNDALVTYVTATIPTNVETMFLAEGAGAINGTGGSAIDTIIGNASDNVLDGGANLDVLVGNGGADTFVFKAGEAVGDIVTDFTSGQDHLKFVGYGAGTFTQVDATHWQINYANGLLHDTITLTNAPSIQPNDVLFV